MMRKTNLLPIIALMLAILANVTLNHTNSVSAQGQDPVGVVVAYIPGQSIAIIDQSSAQHEYSISPYVRILPPPRANMLRVGSFVTIIAPASLGNGKQTAVGIVVHPQVPPGWKISSLSPTPVATNASVAIATATPTGTLLPTDTASPTGTVTETITPPATETPTAMGVATNTSTPTATPSSGTTITANALIDWLRALLRQLLSNS